MVLNKRFYIITISVFVILMTILAIGNLDYTISEALINEHSVWARFFDIFGEIPATLGMVLGITILYGGRSKEKQWWNILSTILYFIFVSLFSFFTWFGVMRYIFHEDMDSITTLAYIIMVVLALITIGISYYFTKTKNDTFKELKKHAWLIIVLVFSEMILVNVVKSIWARPRMRSIIDGTHEFKHWYEIAGWSNDNELKSFPSGHTANAWIGLAYLIFVPYFKNIKAHYWIIGAALWGTLVALSRVVLGAHFLSDVLVGSYITIFLFILFERIFLHKKQ